ncbi:uncharacterized protein LOC114524820 isoform X2 [Dendronephthya gigantea]|uniref:uncharacterized protein LOC114524820 isoform X2 n=2 Tax=Dendronephthya gigantea TaxID=151771 RepID=UPI00106AA373|nr:uncharacterized protein LOC114524820 isoform X2 [Dendronephthya gigantea]
MQGEGNTSNLRVTLEKQGFTSEVISKLEENEIDMVVFQTLSENDLKDIGVESFGARRKLSLLVQRMKSPPPIEALTPCDITMPEITQNTNNPSIKPTKSITNPSSENTYTVKEPFIPTSRKIINFNIKEAIENHSEGRELDNYLEKGGILSSKQRRLLIKICVSALVEKCGLYPTSEQKTLLGMEIIKTYPTIKDNTPGMKGYEHLYDNGHGFIEYRLKNMRTARPDERRGRKRKMEAKTTVERDVEKVSEDEEENLELTQNMNEKVSWMKYNAPSNDKMGRHLQYFKETFKHRRNAIKCLELTTITSIIEKYPRFKDVPDMINVEFQLLYPEECDNFLTKWGTYFQERIIVLGRNEYPAVQQIISDSKNSDLCALYVLAYILHKSTNRKKGKTSTVTRDGAITYLLQNVPSGSDVEEAAKSKDERFTQPFLLSTGNAQNPEDYFIVLDRIVIPCGQDVVKAVDMLFKSHYVFNVEYASPLHNFWEFIAAMIYGVIKPSATGPTVRALGSSCRDLKL